MSNFLVIKTSFNRFFKMLDQKTLPRLSTLIIINTYHRKSNNRMDIYTSSLTAIDIGILFQGRGKYTCLHCDVMRCATRTVHKRKTASRSSVQLARCIVHGCATTMKGESRCTLTVSYIKMLRLLPLAMSRKLILYLPYNVEILRWIEERFSNIVSRTCG